MRSSTKILVAFGFILALVAFSRGGPTPADAVQHQHAPPTRAQRLAACARQHRDDWPATAACRIHVLWTGTDTTAREAVRVAWCESHLSTRDTTGTYWGAWQFDQDARNTYQWGITLSEQTAATQRMHAARGWQPWPRCRPGGADHDKRWRRAPRSLRAYG